MKTKAPAFTSIMTAATAEQAEARLTVVLEYGNTEPAVETNPAPSSRGGSRR